MIYIIITLSVLLILAGYVIYNLFSKVEILETLAATHSEYLVRLNDMIKVSDDRLKELDQKETFSSDDEVGWFFTYVKQVQELLNQYVVENIKNFDENGKIQ